jgi:hypothetical protein
MSFVDLALVQVAAQVVNEITPEPDPIPEPEIVPLTESAPPAAMQTIETVKAEETEKASMPLGIQAQAQEPAAPAQVQPAQVRAVPAVQVEEVAAAPAPEPAPKKGRLRREREPSMAELARDIIGISEQEGGGASSSDSEEDADGVTTADDSTRQASFDLVIGPAPKGGRLRRSKSATQKLPRNEIDDLVPPENGDQHESSDAQGKSKPRSRLRLR